MSKSKIYTAINNPLFKSFALAFFTLIVLHFAGYFFLRNTIPSAQFKPEIPQESQASFLNQEETNDREKVLRP